MTDISISICQPAKSLFHNVENWQTNEEEEAKAQSNNTRRKMIKTADRYSIESVIRQCLESILCLV